MTSPITPKDDELIERSNNFTENFAYDINMVRGLMRQMASRIAELKAERERLRSDISFLLACIEMCDEAEAPSCELDALDLAILDDIRRENPQVHPALSNPPSGEVS